MAALIHRQSCYSADVLQPQESAESILKLLTNNTQGQYMQGALLYVTLHTCGIYANHDN